MNSMFSSFEAFSAEYLGCSGRPLLTSKSGDPTPSSVSARDFAAGEDKGTGRQLCPTNEEGSSLPRDNGRRSSSPMFAPELDGLHSFETLVRY
ncbi:hypothetical protein MLD38_037503 [Melastoma candidum]|uniref:Uncharacterized protein n=1 Tax=Melastoma candidum TaxID=119954 RepID=A0ACB9LN82_9MYRT|nr:hypothetical protein MLD38_037503 [Melastoma candidum]